MHSNLLTKIVLELVLTFSKKSEYNSWILYSTGYWPGIVVFIRNSRAKFSNFFVKNPTFCQMINLKDRSCVNWIIGSISWSSGRMFEFHRHRVLDRCNRIIPQSKGLRFIFIHQLTNLILHELQSLVVGRKNTKGETRTVHRWTDRRWTGRRSHIVDGRRIVDIDRSFFRHIF